MQNVKIFINPDNSGLLWNRNILPFPRIIGYYIGSHPSNFSQNQNLSIPLLFFREQVMLLSKSPFVQLFIETEHISEHDSLEIAQFNSRKEFEIESFKMEKQAYEEKMKLNPSFKLEKPKLPVSIHMISDELPGYSLVPFSFDSMTFSCPKFKIFEYLYKKGYYITKGSNFGGDWLLYDNDPEFSHAKFIVMIVSEDSVAVLDLIASARLATSVKKILLYCWWEEMNQKVGTLEVDWIGW
jgi:tRNA-splicing endonuclease subunit Sen34